MIILKVHSDFAIYKNDHLIHLHAIKIKLYAKRIQIPTYEHT